MASPDISPFLVEGAQKRFNLNQLQSLIYNKTGYRYSLKLLQRELSSRCSKQAKKSTSVFSSFPSLCPGKSLRAVWRQRTLEEREPLVQVIELSQEEIQAFYSKASHPVMTLEIAGLIMEFQLPSSLTPEDIQALLVSKGAQAL